MNGLAARVVLALGIVLGGLSAAAQDAPVQLLPRPPRPEAPAAPTVRIEPAPALGAEGFGTRTQAEGGFADTLWQGTGDATILRGLSRLPVRAASPTQNALTRRLLATTAVWPQAASAARVRGLAALGAAAEAQSLLARAPGRDTDPALAWAEVELAWIAGEDARACGILGGAQPAQPSPAWQEGQVLCLAAAGQRAPAQLALTLLREQAPAEDRPLLDLLEGLAGGPKPAQLPTVPRPLVLAALAATGEAPTPMLLGAADPGLSLRLSRDARLAPDMKLAAAIAAEQAGALAPRDLAALLTAVAFTPAERADAAAVLRAGGPRALALLYQSAAGVRIPVARAEALARLAQLPPEWQPTARRLSGRLLDGLSPVAELSFLTPIAVRARLAAGEESGEDPWLRAARADPALAPLLWIAESVAPPAGGVRAWIESMQALPAAARDARVALAFVLLAALGTGVDAADWPLAASEPVAGPLPDPVAWFALADASARGRVGETVLRALDLLGAEGPAAAPLLRLGTALTALARIGLTEEARALALEAALARGL